MRGRKLSGMGVAGILLFNLKTSVVVNCMRHHTIIHNSR